MTYVPAVSIQKINSSVKNISRSDCLGYKDSLSNRRNTRHLGGKKESKKTRQQKSAYEGCFHTLRKFLQHFTHQNFLFCQSHRKLSPQQVQVQVEVKEKKSVFLEKQTLLPTPASHPKAPKALG